MNPSRLFTLLLVALGCPNCVPAQQHSTPEMWRYHNNDLKKLELIKKEAVSIELYAEPFSMASEEYRKSPRFKQKGELAEEQLAVAKWRRVPLKPEQAATLLCAVKDTQLRYCGTSNMLGQPAFFLTLVVRDAQGKLLGRIEPFDILDKAPEYREFRSFYQLDKKRVKELRLIIFSALDATNLFRKKLTPSSEPCPDCGEVHEVI